MLCRGSNLEGSGSSIFHHNLSTKTAIIGEKRVATISKLSHHYLWKSHGSFWSWLGGPDPRPYWPATPLWTSIRAGWEYSTGGMANWWQLCARHSLGWSVHSSSRNYQRCQTNVSADFRPTEGIFYFCSVIKWSPCMHKFSWIFFCIWPKLLHVAHYVCVNWNSRETLRQWAWGFSWWR